MKKLLYLIAIAAVAGFVLTSCESNAVKQARLSEQRLRDSIRQVNERIEQARAEQERVPQASYFHPGKTYSVDFIYMIGDEAWKRTESVDFYNDGSATWRTESYYDGRGASDEYEGQMVKRSRSYHDKQYVWYEFESSTITNGKKLWIYRSVDLDGNVYQGISGRGGFENIVSGRVYCKF